jgi:Beta-galactosidase trimerisation domain
VDLTRLDLRRLRLRRTIGKPYLGMTGKFRTMLGEFGGYKHPNALSYECALMIAFGAGCRVGDQLHPTGEIDSSTYAIIGRALEEVEAAQPWLIGAEPVVEIALFSASSLLTPGRTDDDARKTPADYGAVRILLETHFLFDVVDRFSDLSKYKVLILPDVVRLDPEMAAQVESFRRGGGRVLLSGESGLAPTEDRFAVSVGASLEGLSPFSPDFMLPSLELQPDFVDQPFVMYAPSHRLRAKSGCSLGQVFDPYFNRTAKHFCSHQHTPPRREPSGFDAAILDGGVAYLAHPVFTMYQDKGQVALKHYVAAAIDLPLGKRRILTNLPSFARVTVARQPDQRRDVVHLLCAAPFYRGSFRRGPIEVVEDLVTLADVTVT